MPGRRRRRHVAERRQAGAVGPARSAEGVRPRRADRRRRRGAAPAGRRRPGDDLQRRRRAVRSPPARAGREPIDRAGDRRADRAFVAAGQRAARQRRDVRSRRRRRPTSTAWAASGRSRSSPTCCPAGRRPRSRTRSQTEFDKLKSGRRLPRRLHRPVEGAGARGAELRARVRAVAGLHVSDSGGAVRVVAPPDHDSAVAAADAALRAAVDHHLPAVAEHLLGARPAGAVRRREEELDSADRPRQPAAGDGPRRRTTRSFRPAAIGCGRF